MHENENNGNNKFKSAHIFHSLCYICNAQLTARSKLFFHCFFIYSLSFAHSIGHSIHLNPLQNIKMYLRISIRLTKSMYNFSFLLRLLPSLNDEDFTRERRRKETSRKKRRYCSIRCIKSHGIGTTNPWSEFCISHLVNSIIRTTLCSSGPRSGPMHH